MKIHQSIDELISSDMTQIATNGCSSSLFYQSNITFLKITDTKDDRHRHKGDFDFWVEKLEGVVI